ncbi:DUF692 domain-containing protein [Nakamurella aerolata]|uniref:DUF692 domain-containing protein n=1 Tax=Nakamurella aerolata TaxID=1656892 RepID=A0A849A9H2_9ACTN|nr:DUF692 domain-containing protein [Nakamurella aerolata]NNG37189.1 DUF692 domain-containing protein [Nakamurella aerolata]
MSHSSLRGAAVAWRPPLAEYLLAQAEAGRLGFSEIVAENHRPGALAPQLLDLATRVPVVPHGVTLGLGGADAPDSTRLRRLADLATELASPLVSEHLAFVRAADGPDPIHGDVLEAGHLLPPPRTRDSLDVLCANVTRAQEQLPVPLAIENIAALVQWPENEFAEGDYLAELVERTGVRLVLDVANLFASATASGGDAGAELRRFPLAAVAYVHIAGGEFDSGLYLDTHGHNMIAPAVDLLGELLALYGGWPPGVLLERDSDVTVDAVAGEFARLIAALQQPAGTPR